MSAGIGQLCNAGDMRLDMRSRRSRASHWVTAPSIPGAARALNLNDGDSVLDSATHCISFLNLCFQGSGRCRRGIIIMFQGQGRLRPFHGRHCRKVGLGYRRQWSGGSHCSVRGPRTCSRKQPLATGAAAPDAPDATADRRGVFPLYLLSNSGALLV